MVFECICFITTKNKRYLDTKMSLKSNTIQTFFLFFSLVFVVKMYIVVVLAKLIIKISKKTKSYML
ncbi:TPA: hypothetical protein DEP21_04180 [Patescibacteria group bacterium]|nr:hypothetical protein [Candidatus Gracilibacteria bacterium]